MRVFDSINARELPQEVVDYFAGRDIVFEESPQQAIGSNDCGIITCIIARRLATVEDPLAPIPPAEINEVRRIMQTAS